MKPSIAVLFALLIPALGGCLPNAVSYHRPTVEGGKTLSGRCVPIESTVDLSVGLVPVRAGLNRKHVFLSLSRMPWQTLRFSSAEFRIRDLQTGRTIEPRSVEVFRDDAVKSLTAPYPQGAGTSAARGGSSFWVHVNLQNPIPERFALIAPSLVVDGEEEAFPVIRFEHQRWMGMSPFNC